MMLSVFLVFLVGSARSLKTPISQANTKARQSGQKKQIVIGSAGAHRTRVLYFIVYLPKTAWTLDSEGIRRFWLEPARIV